ncbi:TetR/AcrR family transcriptional regulator [Corynebacterium propinquum]
MTSHTGHGAGNSETGSSCKTGGSPSNTSLREKKKAETKEAIARAAAHVLLRDGAEALTVAHVAQAAGVSPRTFHNYFQSMEEALLWFIHLHGAEITEAFAQVPAEYSVVEAARAVFVVGSDAGAGTSAATGTDTSASTGEQSSMVALMHVVQQVAAMPNISAAKYAFEENYGNTPPHLLADALAARMPDADQFTIHTYDWLIGAAIASAVDEYTAARSSARSRDVGSSGVSDSGAELNYLLNSAFDALKLIS